MIPDWIVYIFIAIMVVVIFFMLGLIVYMVNELGRIEKWNKESKEYWRKHDERMKE